MVVVVNQMDARRKNVRLELRWDEEHRRGCCCGRRPCAAVAPGAPNRVAVAAAGVAKHPHPSLRKVMLS